MEGRRKNGVPSDAFLSNRPRTTTTLGIEQGIIFRKIQCLLPVDNLSVSVMGILSTEGRPADQALKHDGSDGPPVTAEGVALASKDLRGNVIRGTNGRVSDTPTRLTPRVDLSAAHSKIDLIQRDRVAIVARFV